MCLFIKDGCHIEIAQKDITTFKRVTKRKNNRWEPILRGKELYQYNKVLTARECPYTSIDTIEHLNAIGDTIQEGFHSKTKKPFGCNTICIIPKGSEMCYGLYDEIVSLHIIVFKHIWNYLWYKLRHR